MVIYCFYRILANHPRGDDTILLGCRRKWHPQLCDPNTWLPRQIMRSFYDILDPRLASWSSVTAALLMDRDFKMCRFGPHEEFSIFEGQGSQTASLRKPQR